MKKTIILLLVAFTITVKAQTVKPSKLIPKTPLPFVERVIPNEPFKGCISLDTIYQIRGDKNLEMLYNLLQAGYTGVSTSDNFSKNQAKQYMATYMHLDSILKPQIMKFHPVKSK